MSDFRIEPVNDHARLMRLVDRLVLLPVIALDIETVDWWNRHSERIALIQIAYRTEQREIKVAVIDALALSNLDPLRLPLEQQTTLKVIHNAAFDAVRLAQHCQFQVAPVHDTMVAARLNKEKRYSLQAQAAVHLNLHLDKGAQRSDWSGRPLSRQQLHYAAMDAAATLQLYEHQAKRNLFGNYRLRKKSAAVQTGLPLDAYPATAASPRVATPTSRSIKTDENSTSLVREDFISLEVSLTTLALLGIIVQLPGRYGPEQLAVSVGEGRVRLAGWTIDRMLGAEAEFDEETAKLALAELCDRKLIEFTPTGRLVATPDGESLWQQLKTI